MKKQIEIETVTTDLKRVIIDIKGANISLEEIQDDFNLIDDMGFDSLKMIELIIKIEEVFNIQLDDNELEIETLSNFQKLLLLIQKKIGL